VTEKEIFSQTGSDWYVKKERGQEVSVKESGFNCKKRMICEKGPCWWGRRQHKRRGGKERDWPKVVYPQITFIIYLPRILCLSYSCHIPVCRCCGTLSYSLCYHIFT
jgi:hypothetical protein